jgi:predicted nucleic acid-binding protein
LDPPCPIDGERRLAVSGLTELPVELDHEGSSVAFGKLFQLAADQGLTIYDATYLELAIRKRLPLASEDRPLRQAARRCRVRVL